VDKWNLFNPGPFNVSKTPGKTRLLLRVQALTMVGLASSIPHPHSIQAVPQEDLQVVQAEDSDNTNSIASIMGFQRQKISAFFCSSYHLLVN
jgi:hypothetical protein